MPNRFVAVSNTLGIAVNLDERAGTLLIGYLMRALGAAYVRKVDEDRLGLYDTLSKSHRRILVSPGRIEHVGRIPFEDAPLSSHLNDLARHVSHLGHKQYPAQVAALSDHVEAGLCLLYPDLKEVFQMRRSIGRSSRRSGLRDAPDLSYLIK